MIQKSTRYFFQFTHFAGKEHTFFEKTDYLFDYDYWLSLKINSLIAITPEVPNEIVKKILKKANIC